MFLAPTLKYCSTIDKAGIVEEHKTFRGFNESERLLDRSQILERIDGEKKSALLPKSLKKSFDNGIVTPPKVRTCNECSKDKCCDRCNSQVKEDKEFEANINLIKRKAPNEIG